MNAAKLTLIALSAAVIMIGGCSNDNSLLGPVSDVQSGTGIDRAGRVAGDADSFNQEPKHFTITAVVHMLNVETGCFYLESEEEGMTYTPVTPKDLVLKSGLELKAEGYVDNDIQLYCGNGPAFVIESYTIIDGSKMAGDYSDSGIMSGKQPANEVSNPVKIGDKKSEKDPGVRTVEGLIKFTKDGCTLIETIANEEYVLQYDADIVLKSGDQVRATGNVSTLDVVTCYPAPVFVAEAITVNNSSKENAMLEQPINEIVPVTPKEDSDQQLTRPKDQSSNEQSGETAQERKKKLEEERNREGNINEGP